MFFNHNLGLKLLRAYFKPKERLNREQPPTESYFQVSENRAQWRQLKIVMSANLLQEVYTTDSESNTFTRIFELGIADAMALISSTPQQ